MTIIWLIVWLCYSTPALDWPPNGWTIALMVCGFVDLLNSRRYVS